MDSIALAVVILFGLYLIGLAVASVLLPERAARFLESFAGSAFAHYLEMLIRLVVGVSFVRIASRMPLPTAFTVFGWILVGTTVGLLVIPWQWHHSFAVKSVPQALRYLKLFAAVSFILGALILTAATLAIIRPMP